MSASAKTALGATIGIGTSAGTYTTLSEVVSITPPKINRETIAASDLSTTGGMDYLAAALYDLSPVSVSLHYIAGGTQDDLLVAAATDGLIRYFKLVVKAASGTEDVPFAGYVTSYGIDDLTVDGKQTATMTVKPTGDFTQSASA